MDHLARVKSYIAIFLFVLACIITVYLAPFFSFVEEKLPFPDQTFSEHRSLSNWILFIIFIALFWYAWETWKMREQIIKQNEIAQMPVMILYVRYLPDYQRKANTRNGIFKIKDKFREYLIPVKNRGDRDGLSNYFISLRNVGLGTAFNIKVIK